MEMKLVEGKGLWKRVIRLLKLRNHEKPIIRCNVILESIAKVHAGATFDNGKVKLRIVIRKDELQHMLGSTIPHELVLTSPSSLPLRAPMLSFKQRLQFLRMRQLIRADSMKGQPSPWRPALQSIPEELWS
ncbi:hypothetical protein Scep_000231 [Stephania cephalantha]|uniref:Uncharacterized protein n=1 Tax=Stephania cephalantha TaxID=152367 RepID=A0AAP0Q2R0_9MAGN